MREIVVTGGVATGKSRFCRTWVDLAAGAAVWHDADAAVHALYDDPAVVARVAARFGNAVVREGGVDRKALGELVFREVAARKDLEEMIHPLVRKSRENARAEAAAAGTRWFLSDIPLYFETGGTGAEAGVPVVVVACGRETQRRRLLERNGLDNSRAARILASQAPLERKMARADHVVWNEGSEAALVRQAALLQALLADED